LPIPKQNAQATVIAEPNQVAVLFLRAVRLLAVKEGHTTFVAVSLALHGFEGYGFSVTH